MPFIEGGSAWHNFPNGLLEVGTVSKDFYDSQFDLAIAWLHPNTPPSNRRIAVAGIKMLHEIIPHLSVALTFSNSEPSLRCMKHGQKAGTTYG